MITYLISAGSANTIQVRWKYKPPFDCPSLSNACAKKY